ncbi:MAG: helix-turn-helix transcriptional regulator [Ruthenibacterium sp.]
MKHQKQENPLGAYESTISVTERKEMIAPIIAAFRKEKHYTQKEVAEIIGVSPQAYSGYEKAYREPPVEILVRLSFLYKAPIDILVQKDVFEKGTKGMMNQTELLQNMIQQMREEAAKENSDPAVQQTIIDAMEALTGKMAEAVKELELQNAKTK